MQGIRGIILWKKRRVFQRSLLWTSFNDEVIVQQFGTKPEKKRGGKFDLAQAGKGVRT